MCKSQRPEQRRIATAARKGGVGKTSLTTGLASIFAAQKHRVLVIDLDPQSNAAFVLGANPTAPGTSALLLDQSPTPLEINEYLYVLPGGPDLMSHAIQASHPEDLLDAVSELDFDILLFDCPPGNEHLERMALIASDTVLVVTDAHPLALMGASRVLADLHTNQQKKRRSADRWAIIESRLDFRRTLDKELDAEIARRYPNVPRFTVRQNAEIAYATANRLPIMDYAPNARVVREIKDIAQWSLEEDHAHQTNNETENHL